MSNPIGIQFSTADYTSRIASVASVSKVDSEGDGIEIQVHDRWSSGVLQSILETDINGKPVEVRARRPQRGTRPSRQHTIRQQMNAIAALQVLSGGDVNVSYQAQPEPAAPVIRRRRPGRGSRPIYSEPATPKFSSIEITVKDEREKQLADDLIADEIYGAPVSYLISSR